MTENPNPKAFVLKKHKAGDLASAALYSASEQHRFTLWRDWSLEGFDMFNTYVPESFPHVQFIGLNPSTATEEVNDPTVTRCIERVRKMGFKRFCMTNIFPYRSTDPNGLEGHYDDHGDDNLERLLEVAAGASMVICAWGCHNPRTLRRGKFVTAALIGMGLGEKLHCLKVNNDGSPRHPLYVPLNIQPTPYNPTK